jgi:diguanylate cyclase (GGDEF)-like protein
MGFLFARMKPGNSNERRAIAGGGMLMFDVDHFKAFNDTYGHQNADAVLCAISRAMVEEVRGEDVVCRYGGEEFAILLPGAGIDESRDRAEALREAVYERTERNVTVSIGVSAYPTAWKFLGIASACR